MRVAPVNNSQLCCFNSTQVRLEAPGRWMQTVEKLYFNSTQVRLEELEQEAKDKLRADFNSTQVRLEVLVTWELHHRL